ncbi:MAG: hypothetical protein E6G33_09750 [Actinobacteria bacterium]|nr:MAG: hypothetical protein E6G33_09750 [Actinomycetota bacterium]
MRNAVALVPTRASAGSSSFSDPTGDAGVAPDISSVTVSNDDQGLITFRITVPNRSSLGPDDAVAVPLGTDDPDLANGWRSDGVNFVLVLDATGVSLLVWDGEDMVTLDPPPGSVTGSFNDGVGTVTVLQEDLAPGFPDMSVPIELRFYALGIAFKGNDVLAQDDAPDGDGIWNYRLAEARRVVLTSFNVTQTVKPGATLIVTDTGAAVASGKISCRARLGSKALKGKARFFTVILTSPATGRAVRSPNATCSFKVPKQKSKGKTIRGSMSLRESGVTLSRSFTTRVR